MNNFNNMYSIIKKGMICSFGFGFSVGLLPNKINIKINNKKLNMPFPLITGCIGTFGFLSFPFLLTNYYLKTAYFDKLVDKYDFDFKRYYQYDGTNNKYGYPSYLTINIRSKLEPQL